MRADFEKKFGDTAIYGKLQLVNWGMSAAPLPENAYDFILVSRAVHGWMRQDGMVTHNFAQLARGLKPAARWPSRRIAPIPARRILRLPTATSRRPT